MWVCVAGFTILFYICSRGLEILSNVLIDKLKGNPMSDDDQAYRHLGRCLHCARADDQSVNLQGQPRSGPCGAPCGLQACDPTGMVNLSA
jgi:hypothetical protein